MLQMLLIKLNFSKFNWFLCETIAFLKSLDFFQMKIPEIKLCSGI